MTNIWDQKPIGTRFISEEKFDEWLAWVKADYDDLKADAEIARKTVDFETHKESLRYYGKKGSHIIVFKDVWEEKKEKAEKWDIIERDPDATIILSEVFDEILREREKLEGIVEHIIKHRAYLGRLPFGRALIGRWRVKLEKRLGAEG